MSAWSDSTWLESAHGWIQAELEHLRLEPAGPIEQPHVRPWSTVLRVPTSGGPVWFKANMGALSHEAAVVTVLGRRQPDVVPELLAADLTSGWMPMRDGGTRMRDLDGGLSHWEGMLTRYAELQIDAAEARDELLGHAVPDRRLAVFPELYEELLDDPVALGEGLPEALTTDEVRRLRGRLPQVRAMCEQLEALGIPETIQHDDLHDANVFVRDGSYLFFDWGDSCVSHPFHTLVVTFRALAHRFELDLQPGGPELLRLRDAYLEPFAGYGNHDQLVAAVDLAHLTGTVGRTLAWHRFVYAREPEFRADDAETVPYGLKRLLDLGPL